MGFLSFNFKSQGKKTIWSSMSYSAKNVNTMPAVYNHITLKNAF